MPGWDILQQPFQYHPPVAPETPVPDNTAAKIISAGTDTAVGGFIRMAIARKQAELEEKQQVQQAALTLRAQDIAEENNKLDYEVGMANADSLKAYRSGGGGLMDPRARAKLAFDWRLQQKQMEADRALSIQELDQKAIPEAHEMGLNNEKNWVEDPVGTLDKYMTWSGRYGNAVEGQIPKELARYKARAELLKIPVRAGSVFKEGYYKKPEGAAIGTQPAYVMGQYVGGETKQVPLAEFVQKWRYHPELRDQMREELKAAGGNTRIIDRIEKAVPGVQKRTVIRGTNIPVPFTGTEIVDPGKPQRTVHQIQLNPDVESTLKKAESGTFLKGESQVPTPLTAPAPKAINPYGDDLAPDQSNLLPPGADSAVDGTTFPEPDLPPLAPGSSIESPSGIPAPQARIEYAPTQADRTLEQARRAFAINPGARDEIRRRLASLHINPELLGA